jgi:DNA-binding protein H-NS
MKFTGENRSTRGKTCPSSTLSTTNPTWTGPGIEPGPPQWVAGAIYSYLMKKDSAPCS